MSITHLFISIDFMLTIKINGWDLKINQHTCNKESKQTNAMEQSKKSHERCTSLLTMRKRKTIIYIRSIS